MIALEGPGWQPVDAAGIKPPEAGAADGVWSVSQGTGAPTVSLRLGEQGSRPLGVSFDSEGRLGIDRVRAVCWLGSSLLVGTDDGVLECSGDLAVIRGHSGAVKGMTADPARRRVLVQKGDQASASYASYDGKRWADETAEGFAHAEQLHFAAGSEPLAPPLVLGLKLGEETVELEYRGHAFVHDTPPAVAQGSVVTSDGKSIYVATQAGLLLEDAQQRLLSIAKIEGGAAGMLWRATDSTTPSLYVLSAGGKVFRFRDGKLDPTEREWQALAAYQAVELGGRRYEVDRPVGGAPIKFRAADARHFIVQTPAGMTLWNRGPAGLEFAGLRQDLAAIEVPAVKGDALAVNARGELEELAAQGTWVAVRLTPEDRAVLARSEQWQCRQARPGRAVLEMRNADGQWFETPLDAAGDLAFRRPVRLASSDQAGTWTGAADVLVRYQRGAAGTWLPTLLQRPQHVDPTATGRFERLLSINGTLHVEVGGKPYALGPGPKWTPAEAGILARTQEILWDGGGWSLKKGAGGGLQVRTQIGGREHEVSWDPRAGRFDLDTVADAAMWKEAVWLATAKGVLQLKAADRRAEHLLDASNGQRFAMDRKDDRLVIAADPAGTSAAPVDFGGGPAQAQLGKPLAPEQAATIYGAAYRDSVWSVQVGQQPSWAWRGIPTTIVDGRFRHDDFRSVVLAPSGFWIATPAAVQRFRWHAAGIALEEAAPLPGKAAAPEMLSATETSACVLLTVELKRSDVVGLSPVLNAQGRFDFDQVATAMAEAGEVWLGGPGGIVRQDPADGSIRYWYRKGVSGEGTQPLTGIVLLGRFGPSGDPVPSWASAQRPAQSILFALDDQDRVWRYEGEAPGGWHLIDENPWTAPGGRWLFRTPSLAAVAGPDQGPRLSYQKARWMTNDDRASRPAMLWQGRLLADVVEAAAFHGDSAWLATPIGVVESDLQGRYRRMWARAGGQAVAAGSVPELFLHPADGRIHYSPDGQQMLRLDTKAGVWQKETVDDAFRRTAQVLVRNDFWTWSRWGGGIRVRIFDQPDPTFEWPEWPLFADGRFSFDVLRQFRIVDDNVWATTAGGIVRFHRTDMKIREIDRTARDLDTGRTVPVPDAEAFAQDGTLACSSASYQYAWRDGRWSRYLKGQSPTGNEIACSEASLRWSVGPLLKEPEPLGFDVQQYDDDTGKTRRYSLLSGTSYQRLCGLVAADGRLWLCLDHGIYRLDPD